jgi:hypothetical protein
MRRFTTLLIGMAFAASAGAQVPGYYHPAGLYRADFYPETLAEREGLRRAWMRITYMADVEDKQGDLTVNARVGDVEYVFNEYDCQKKLVRVENGKPYGFITIAGRSRASEFYAPVPGSVEEMALAYFCRPVAPHAASGFADHFWDGTDGPGKDEHVRFILNKPSSQMEGFINTVQFFSYVLYLCTQSDMTCDKAMWDAKSVAGIVHREYRFGDAADCQAKGKELSKAKPLAHNQWYECRKEKATNDE